MDELMLIPEIGQAGTLGLSTARLSEGFYGALMAHAVPVPDAAVRAISNNSHALDAYLWLAYRLYKLRGPTEVPWPSLFQQFGTAYSRLDNFRMRFAAVLRQALAVYPEARVEIEREYVRLHPSPQPVPGRTATIRKLSSQK